MRNEFNLIEKKTIKDSEYLVFEHKKTKAKLLKIKNEDTNNFFSIGFRTPPLRDTGVTHIIEHSVLNGSKKYKTKEPFMDMIKSSLNTFLNAMTFPDKTLYPIGSRNEEDYHNLMDVYLDAVFNPRAIEDERIFRQEGTRIDALNDELKYNGVVYNEMKGSLSSPENQVISNISKELYRGTIYELESGGNPYDIINLTYDEFKEYYKTYYHPSNSYIFLYGDMDLDRSLEHVDEYLKNYDYKKIDSLPRKIVNLEEKTIEMPFNTVDKELDKKNYISFSVVLGDSLNPITRIMPDILSNLLIDSEGGIIKNKLIKEGLVEDVFTVSYTAREISFSIVGKNTSNNPEKFKEVIIDELEKIVEKGFEKELLESNLNKWEYALREKQNSANRGYYDLIQSFDTWLYDGSPIDAFQVDETINKLKQEAKNGFIENYINENILNNEIITILHKPIYGLNQAKDEKIEMSLKEKRKALSSEEYKAYEKRTLDFTKWQDRENTKEQLNTIPKLSLDDISTKFERINRKIVKKDNLTYLLHESNTNGIEYLRLTFKGNQFDEKDLPYLMFVLDLLGRLDTKNYGYEELSNIEYLNTGGVYLNAGVNKKYDSDEVFIYINLSTRLLGNYEEASKYILEIMYNTKFDDKKRIENLLLMMKSRFEYSLYEQAHVLMRNRAKAQISKIAYIDEYLNGLEYYKVLNDIIDNFNDDVVKKLKEIYEQIFSKENLIVDIACKNSEKVVEKLKPLTDNIRDKKFTNKEINFEKKDLSEAFISNADVQYISKAYDINKLNVDYSGKYILLGSILSSYYLYQEVRAKNGAYGVGVILDNDNILSTYSYRDPSLRKTIEAYENMGNFLQNFSMDNEEFESNIIGTVGGLTQPMSPASKASFDLNMFLKNKPYDILDQLLEDIINATQDDLKNLSNMLTESMQTNNLEVLGSKKTIEENKDIFDKIINI